MFHHDEDVDENPTAVSGLVSGRQMDYERQDRFGLLPSKWGKG